MTGFELWISDVKVSAPPTELQPLPKETLYVPISFQSFNLLINWILSIFGQKTFAVNGDQTWDSSNDNCALEIIVFTTWLFTHPTPSLLNVKLVNCNEFWNVVSFRI